MTTSRWEGIDSGRRPTKDDLIPYMLKILNRYGADPLMALGMPTSTLRTKLEKLPIDVLFVLHDTMVNMENHLDHDIDRWQS